MTSVPVPLHRVKAGYYAQTALGSIASSYYFNYLFFFLHDRFGFGNRANLAVAALHGSIYIFSAWQCGKFAERRGFHTSLQIGFAGLTLCMIAGAIAPSAGTEIAVLVVFSVVLLFVWPAMEALVIQHEPPGRVPHMVGIYNCVWSAAAAFAYFTGGALYDWLGRGAVFGIPAGLFAGLLLMTLWLKPLARSAVPDPARGQTAEHGNARPVSMTVTPRTFLELAWLANPFSYVAVYTLLAVMPGVAVRLGLSPARVGLVCSVWMFGRLAAFITLWQWNGWHYRFRWLSAGYVLLTASFISILLMPSVWLIVLAQIVFGLSCGLMYYSSLFYSMDVGDAKAENGGLHEAAIGAGICAGPAVGAASLSLFPSQPNVSAFAVTGLLAAGFIGMLTIWTRARRRVSG